MIVSKLEQIDSGPLFFHLPDYCEGNLYLKLEGLNIGGSVKLQTAIHLIKGLEDKGEIIPGYHQIIESSSGNLGVALSIICKSKGYHFTCVTDPNTNEINTRLMRLYGANIIQVTEKDESGGYLGTRIKLIEAMLKENRTLIWTNQYASQYNIHAHYTVTAKNILNQFPHVDYLFIGAGTTGTLMGCANFFKNNNLKTKVIAVDAYGSVTFDMPSAKRKIPGIGTSKKPSLINREKIDDLILVKEADTVNACHNILEKKGLFVGGSTGSVLHAVKEYSKNFKSDDVIVAISPDFGERYIDTIYDKEWVAKEIVDIKC